MLLAHWACPVPALIAILLTLGAALSFALLWARDIDRLTAVVRRVAADDAGPGPMPAPPWLRSDDLRREVERLSRRVAGRTALVEQLQRADAAIVERLPDPLIVLAADRSVRRANAAARAAFGADIGAVLRHPGAARRDRPRASPRATCRAPSWSLPVPVPRELQATVVPMDPPLADGGRGRGGAVGPHPRARHRAHARRLRRQCQPRAAHAARLADRLHRDAARPGGRRSARATALPGDHGRARRADEPADRRSAEPVADRADRAPGAVGQRRSGRAAAAAGRRLSSRGWPSIPRDAGHADRRRICRQCWPMPTSSPRCCRTCWTTR